MPFRTLETTPNQPAASTMETKPARKPRAAKKVAPKVERPGYGPFNLAKGAKVRVLTEDWREAIALLEDEDWVALDLETSGLSPFQDYITVVGLYGPKSEVAAVIHTKAGIPYPELIDWLGQPQRKFITQNGVCFDILFLKYAGVDVSRPQWFDTLIAEQVVTTTNRQGVPKDLQAIVKRNLGIDIAKDIDYRTWTDPVLTQEQVRYVAEDISFLPAVRDAQYAKADRVDAEWGVNEHFGTGLRDAVDFEHKLAPIVVGIQLRGLPIDREALEEYYQSQVMEAAAAHGRLVAALGDINWNSHVQIKRAFKAVYDVDLLSVKADELAEVRDLFLGTDIPATIDDLLAYKKANKRAGMYNEEFLENYAHEGWLKANFRQCGTDTGRFSSSRPNLQQIPKSKGEKHGRGMRHVFGNYPGYSIVSVDYSQIEFRVAADYAEDEAAIDLFTRDAYDVHTMVAATVFDVAPEAVTYDQRQLSKAMSFTLLFGGGAGLLSHYAKSQGADLPLARARPLVTGFFDQFQGLARMRTRAYKIADAGRPFTLKQPTGMRRVLVPGKDLRATLILNNIVQGTAAAGMKYALIEAERDGLSQYIGAVVHDEIVAAVPDDFADEYAERLTTAMIYGMRRVVDRAEVRAESSIGKTWG